MSNHIRKTISFCEKCYFEVPTEIFFNDHGGVSMRKMCAKHGESISLVEKDFMFWMKCMEKDERQIYGGHFIDVTERCNLHCKHCYFPVCNDAQDKSITEIVQEATVNRGAASFILTGGEPFLRNDILDLIDVLQMIRPVDIVTNGTLIDNEILTSLTTRILVGKELRLNLSIHPDVIHDNERFLSLVRAAGIKISSILFVINDLEQIPDAVEFAEKWKDCVCRNRIKAASNIWHEENAGEKIYTSEMKLFMESLGARTMWWANNKVSFFNMILNGLQYMLVSWYEVGNVDLLDISCPPTYTAKNGRVENLVTSMIINEGIDKSRREA